VWQTEQKYSSLLDWGISPGIGRALPVLLAPLLQLYEYSCTAVPYYMYM
jgi:hypothetical protein